MARSVMADEKDEKDKDKKEEAKVEAWKAEPMTPLKRKRMQTCFEQGNTVAAKGSYDYAHEMFTQCVVGDPGNLIYSQNMLQNLYKKYKNNKKGSKFAGLRAGSYRNAIKKANTKKQWPDAVKAACGLLKLNPWDAPTLIAIAKAMEEMDETECQVFYLRQAVEADSKSAGVNRKCSEGFVRAGHYDSAIACWHRIKQSKKADEEADRMISTLSIQKTIHEGGYEKDDGTIAESSTEVKADKHEVVDETTGKKVELSTENRYQQAIRANPSELSNYLQLGQHFVRYNRYDEAEEVLNKAMQVSGGDVGVRERIEDVQLQRARDRLVIAEKHVRDNPGDEQKKKLAHQIRVDLAKLEIQLFGTRVERYPANHALKFELGLRLKMFGKYNEAIKLFQEARKDKSRTARANLELGKCFHQIKQYKLAMTSYETALAATRDSDDTGSDRTERIQQTLKDSLYQAGRLAMGLAELEKDPAYLDKAETYLTELAGMDFSFKDVADRLDKIPQMRNKE